jgi:hypothetical protein
MTAEARDAVNEMLKSIVDAINDSPELSPRARRKVETHRQIAAPISQLWSYGAITVYADVDPEECMPEETWCSVRFRFHASGPKRDYENRIEADEWYAAVSKLGEWEGFRLSGNWMVSEKLSIARQPRGAEWITGKFVELIDKIDREIYLKSEKFLDRVRNS